MQRNYKITFYKKVKPTTFYVILQNIINAIQHHGL